ncbi:MAG: cation transporter, partial [Bacteroidales bacterium]|nr:cation transporter [Bacteroidales bacterium]
MKLSTQNSEQNRKAGITEGVVSVIVNTLLFALKYWAGIVTGSLAIVADAWHTMSDSISSVVLIAATGLSNKKPDKEHPFGHGRWEQIAAIFIGIILAIIAFDFLKNSILRLKDHTAVTFGTLAIVVTSISVVAKEGLAQYAFRLARKTGNVAIKADGWHHRSDALSSVVVLIGILLAKHFWWMDSLLGIIIALMLFYATYTIIKEAITKILGEEPSDEIIAKITKAVEEMYPEGLQLHHFHLHNYVTHQEMTFHIRLPGELSLEEGHSVATAIEKMIEERFNITSTIHVE